MSEALRISVAHAEEKEVGPNYFGYYIREILELSSQKEDDLLPLSFEASMLASKTYTKENAGDIIDPNCNGRDANSLIGSNSLFSNSIGYGLPDIKRERLKASLKQAVLALSQEVDEMLGPVFRMCRIQAHLKGKEHLQNCSSTFDRGVVQPPSKKQKLSSTPHMSGIMTYCGTDGCGSYQEVKDDLLVLLDNCGPRAVETVKRYSNELSAKLGHMEQQLEELLDIVMSKCRPMSLTEKQELRNLIQKMPPKNLDRIVEIVQRNKQEESHSCKEISIELEKEDNATLWRLYYYVEAVANAEKLSP
ncbi:PREDICTED: uncharacterized protein LOC104591545 isoform X2 [Nelumbo nucifera]|uniref:Uncharacterized protein LOC104591545 isoform X2 n=1 Tax=Nelumbo nucifera TaxID=4432 RepID=A0A1U7ZLE7_NELNU|nr:PREDICTED: uncharacterized protein LOC104591545 isoform X2 [Nelumbo nucifera]